MRRSRLILVAALVVVIAIPTVLILKKRRMSSELDAYLDAQGFRSAPCPGGEPFGRSDVGARCFTGKLPGGRPVTLLLGSRWQAETTNVPKGSGIAQENYIGLALADPDPALLATWQGRLGRGGDDPIRAARTENGLIVVWRGLHSLQEVAKRLDSLQASLP